MFSRLINSDEHSFFTHFVHIPLCPTQSTAHKVLSVFLHLVIFPLALARGAYWAGCKIHSVLRSAFKPEQAIIEDSGVHTFFKSRRTVHPTYPIPCTLQNLRAML